MSLPAKWKHLKAGHEVPLTLDELDRLEKHFGGEPNGDSRDASLFWEHAVLRPPASPEATHSLYLRGFTPAATEVSP